MSVCGWSLIVSFSYDTLICDSKEVRKSIARVLTVINQNQKQNVALLYANKKYKPHDLRPKKLRAIRRQMTKFEQSRRTPKAIKKEIHFAKRKFAIKK